MPRGRGSSVLCLDLNSQGKATLWFSYPWTFSAREMHHLVWLFTSDHVTKFRVSLGSSSPLCREAQYQNWPFCWAGCFPSQSIAFLEDLRIAKFKAWQSYNLLLMSACVKMLLYTMVAPNMEQFLRRGSVVDRQSAWSERGNLCLLTDFMWGGGISSWNNKRLYCRVIWASVPV